MTFTIKKQFIKGNLKSLVLQESMRFISFKHAKKWAEGVNSKNLDYKVIELYLGEDII